MVTLGAASTAISSVVFVEGDGSILVGASADRRSVDAPGSVARHFKRRMGDPAPMALGASRFPAHVLLGKLLRWVLDRVEEREGAPPSTVAVTHPANWGDFKLEHLRQALEVAGVPDAITISEPEAAAIHYASQERVPVGSHVAVYDLGGGTFDAAVLRKDQAGFSIIGEPRGIEQLGGIDFDDVVFDHVVAALGPRLGDLDRDDPVTIAALARLRRECEAAKIDLSVTAESTIPVSLPGIQDRVRITREEFEAAIRPMVADTIASLERGIAAAGLTADDLHAVLLVGGSSRIPLIAQMVTDALGRPVAVDADPKNTIALGAARFAATAEGSTLGSEEAAPGPGPTPDPTPQPEGPGDERRRIGTWLGVIGGAAAAVALTVLLWPGGDDGPGTTAAQTAVPSTTPPTGIPDTTTAGTTIPPTTAPGTTGIDPVTTLVAFSNQSGTAQIHIATLDGSLSMALTSENTNAAPAISPDGTMIAFSSNRLDDDFEVFVMDIDGSNVTRITDSPGIDGHPAWSPDGTRLAFRSERNGNSDIFVVDLASGALTQITDDPELDAAPDWSPDGTRIAFQGVVDGFRQLFIIGADGSGLRRLTESQANDTRPTWSPDGAFIAFESNRGGNNDLFAISVATGAITRLTDSAASDEAPDWSPDGSEVVFESDRNGDRDIFALEIDVTGEVLTPAPDDLARVVVALPGDDRRPATGVGSLRTADPEAVVLEAESGLVSAPMTIVEDAAASGGAYVVSQEAGAGTVELGFDVAGGTYLVWASVRANGTSADSFLFSVDGGEPDIWDLFEEAGGTLPSGFAPDLVSLRCGGAFDSHLCAPLLLELAPGSHTLTFATRDRNTWLDVVVVTSDLDPTRIPDPIS